MIKLSFLLKILGCSFLFTFFVFGIFGFNNDSEIKYDNIKNIKASELSCKGPADVILVIDRSATMNEYGKFDIAKAASINFINRLFATFPDDIYGSNAYHQIGLVAFHNLTDNKALNRNSDYIKSVINQSDGILGNDYPLGYRRTSLAISTAKNSLDPDLSDPNPSATKTMIVLTDGDPYYNTDLAKANADSAKNDKGIRIISVGLKLDSISDETEREAAEEFIKYIASPSFCYYVSDSGGELEGCNSISADNLTEALEGVYDDITAAICDENPPTILISKKPFGTLYNVDNLVITSTAIDDIGFKSHSMEWSDNWLLDPDSIQNTECDDLTGTVIESETVIECSVGESGEIGPFSFGVNVSYRSSATDANDNEATLELPNPRNVTVATVTLSVPELLRNENKTIMVEISDYSGNDEILISIDAPVLGGEEIEIDKAPMNCSGVGNSKSCVYVFNPDCGWTDGITNGFANNIYVDIYIYAQSSDVGVRQIASSENNLLVSSSEGSSWAGTCADNINNDCDYDEYDDPIIDEEEMVCDAGAPSIGILRVPAGNIYDLESDGATPMTVKLESTAGDSNGIKRHTIYYKIDSGSFQIAFDCNDADADDHCDENASQNPNNISATVGPFDAGKKVEYYSTAVDHSGNDNTTSTEKESFIVKNRECEGVGYLGDCLATSNGKCCGGVCNATISNLNSYNSSCALEICGDGLVYEEEVWIIREEGKALQFDGVDDYVDCGDIDALDTADNFTIEFWFKRDSDIEANSNHDVSNVIFAQASDPSNDNIEIGTDNTFIEIYLDTVSYDATLTYDAGIQDNIWYHFVFTYNSSATQEAKLYLGGTNIKEWNEWGGALDSSSASPLTIGNTDHIETPFNGIIDEVRVYSRVLSATEVAEHSDGIFNNNTGLIGYWDFDEGTGITVNDSSTNGNDGTLVNFSVPIIKEGILWQWGIDTAKNNTICSEGGNSDGCFSYLPYVYFWDGGCEERAYVCSAGYCNYGITNRNEDHCIGGGSLILNDYECVSNSCALNPATPAENDICDVELDNLSVNAYNSVGTPISGSSISVAGEVLDDLSGVSLQSITNDINGIKKHYIYYKKVAEESFFPMNCPVTGECKDPEHPCDCEKEIGPFNIGETILFYAMSQDNSPNETENIRGLDGLRYYYYTYSSSGTDRQGVFKGSGIDTNLDHNDWGSGRIFIEDNAWEDQSNAAIVWEGFVRPDVVGEYNFYAYSDDGIKVYVDGNEIIDYWGYTSSEHNGIYTFTSLEPVPIKIKWYDGDSSGGMRLGWKSPGGTKVYPVPSSNLSASYSLTVRDGECYDVPGGNKVNLAPCDSGSGMCCGGSCDSSVSSTSLDAECRVDACSGTNWVYAAINEFGDTNEGDSCGSTDSCFDYYSFSNEFYSGCKTGGNECSSGYCAVSSTVTSAPACSGNLLTNYDCNPNNETGTCQPKDSNINCSIAGDDDGDSASGGTACNCDCDNYDLEEKVYSSLSFDGADDYVNFGDIDVLDAADNFTIEFWFKRDSDIEANSNHDVSNVMFAQTSDPSNDNIEIGTDNTYIEIYLDTVSYDATLTYDAGIQNDVWYHFVLVYDSNKIQETKLYIDGINIKAWDNWGGALDDSFTSPITIGNTAHTETPFDGLIDEVRIYDRAFYLEEVGDHYNGIFADDTGLMGHWNFDEGTGKIAEDSSGNGNDGVLSNVDGTLYGMNDNNWVSGKYGNGLDFDGSNDYINIAGDLGNPSAMSLEFWFYVSEGDKNRLQYFMDGRNGGNWWFLQSYNPNYSGNINFDDRVEVESDQWTAGQWNHLVLAVNSSSSKIYINGDLESTGSGHDPDLGSNVRIGTRYTNYSYFRGKFDEVRIYNYALLETEAEEHYYGIFNNNPGLISYWNFNEETGTTAYDSSENGPQWMKYGNGDDKDENENVINILNRNVPVPWQVCTDAKDNDCDGDLNNYDEENATGASDCDGEVDFFEFTATAMDRSCVINPDCTEGSDLFNIGNVTTVDDINIERMENDFTIAVTAADEFLIKEVKIEWTTDNWANRSSKICEGGICEARVCEEGSDCILSSLLSAGNIFSFRVCVWDDSVNSNNECTDYYNLVIESSNLAPEITSLSVRSYNHNFCTDGLEYVLEWVFSDPDGDGQASYEIQIKEDNDDFSNTDELVVNVKKNIPSSYYQILSYDFINNKEIGYGNRVYYWRLKVTDNRGGGYGRTTDWVQYNDPSDSDGDGNNETFTTPIYEYPQIDFSAISDSDTDCLYKTGHEYTGNEDRCDFGENITFFDDSAFVNCDNSNNEQCITASVSECDVSTGLCIPCSGNSVCVKFGAGYKCEEGVCNPPDGFVCDPELLSNDCKTADAAKCDEGTCVPCDDDAQCSNEKFGTADIDYFCNAVGECDNENRREWYFYGTDVGIPDSVDINPINNYIESESKIYNVILKIEDVAGNSCYKIKNIILGGGNYPKWNESSAHSGQ